MADATRQIGEASVGTTLVIVGSTLDGTAASRRGWLVNPHGVMSRPEHAKPGLTSASPV
jgi:hypothetical protein